MMIRGALFFLLGSSSCFGAETLPPVVQSDRNLACYLELVPHHKPTAYGAGVPFQEPSVAFLFDVIDQPLTKAFACFCCPFGD